MFGTSPFYNETTRRYIATFGTLFNDISITRKNNAGSTVQTMKIPLNYAPMQKLLAKLEQDPNLTAPAISLPRMSFEMTSMVYDGTRKLPSTLRNVRAKTTNDNLYSTQYVPAPYNLDFELNIMAKYSEDATKIVEQIIPYFTPNFTISVKLIDEFDRYIDIPVILNSVAINDTYEGSFEERRAIIWTLTFTVKGYYFGPVSDKKIIKFATVNTYTSLTSNNVVEYVTVQPGLTANGEPTTDANNSIAYSDINFDDDWTYIVRIEDD